MPGDVGSSYVPAGSFMYYNNDPTMMGNPVIDTDFNHLMRARYRNGAHLQHAGQDINYIFPDDPSIPGGFSECADNHTPGDRRYVIASNNFILNAGAKEKIVMALVVHPAGGGCPSASFNGIKIMADTAWAVYHSLPTGIATQTADAGNDIVIYPNPAHDKLIIDCGASLEDKQVSIYNMVGQRLGTSSCKRASKNTVDISSYPAGVYVVSYPQGGVDKRMMFVKQ